MIQRRSEPKLRNVTFAIGCFLLAFLIIPQNTFAVNINVVFNFTTIDNDTMFRDVSANFPNPVLSLVTVVDYGGRYVHGLAARDKWLGPEDITETGEIVNDVWRILTEYHQENHAIPADPNIKHTSPPFMVTEIANYEGFGSSVILAMDYSGSMDDDIYKAEDGARVFVREMNAYDRAAILKFTGVVELYQDFTSDTTLLMDAIERQPSDRLGTPLYDAIYQSVEECKDEPGRRAVVVYTDGKNSEGTATVDEIISKAKNHKVRIFTIGLGGDIEESELRKIAQRTGGDYRRAPSADDLADIYREIYEDISGFYVLAHSSTDPFFNGTWRVLEVTINSNEYTGDGHGEYFVPFVHSNVRVRKNVFSDSLVVSGADTLYFALAGDTVSYKIKVDNWGRGTAGIVEIRDLMPDSMDVIDFSIEPDAVRDDTLIWRVPRMDSGTGITIEYRARIRDRMPMNNTLLFNTVQISCPYDSLSTDNTDQSVLAAFGMPDFSTRAIPLDDMASPGYPLGLDAVISNFGNAAMTTSFDVGFYADDLDSEPVCIKTVSAIAINDSVEIEGIWDNPIAGNHQIYIKADWNNRFKELDETNNIDETSILVGIDSLIVRVSDVSLSDAVLGLTGKFPSPVFDYVNVMDQNYYAIPRLAGRGLWLGLQDQSDAGSPVGDIWQTLMEYHQENTAYPANQDVRENMRITEIENDEISVIFGLDLSLQMNPVIQSVRSSLNDWVDLFSRSDQGAVVGFRSENDVIQALTQDTGEIQNAFSTNTSYHNRMLYDGISNGIQLAQNIWGRNVMLVIVAGGDQNSTATLSSTIQLSRQYGVPVYIIDLNPGPGSESLISLADGSGGVYLDLDNISALEAALEKMNRLFRNYYALYHTSSDTVQNSSWRIVDLTVSYFNLTGQDQGLYHAPYGDTDAAVSKTAWTEASDENGWMVSPNDTIDYTITVRNAGHWGMQNVVVEDELPSNLIPVDYDVQPEAVEENTLRWVLETLDFNETVQIGYRCFVDTLYADNNVGLVNLAQITAAADDVPGNNTANAIVNYIPLTKADLVVQKEGIGTLLMPGNGGTMWYVDPEDTVTWQVDFVNQGQLNCYNIVASDVIPDHLTLIDFTGADYTLNGSTLTWTLNKLESRGGTANFTYTCVVDSLMPPWDEPLVNQVAAAAVGEENLENNTDQDTVWVRGITPLGPEVQVSPNIIIPLDSILVEVMSPVTAVNWDLKIVFENGETIETFADPFIDSHVLVPTEWLTVYPQFSDTRMRTEEQEERVAVIFETTGIWDDVRSDTAYFTIRSADELWLDENTFTPDGGKGLGLRFMLSSNRRAEIVIYDLAGGFVKRVADENFNAGWNTVYWDGTDKLGRTIGSGVYLVIMTSGHFQKARKFIVVR